MTDAIEPAERSARAARPGPPASETEGPGPLVVRAMTEADWPAARTIYRAGIATGHATFETSAPDWQG